MKIGLFFGTFDPIHIGHALIARYAMENFNLKEVWFIVSPHNPLKQPDDTLNMNVEPKYRASLSHRYQMVHSVCKDMRTEYEFMPNDIEYLLPKPSYTADTLRALSSTKEYKKHNFHIIMGTDCFIQLDKWKDYNYILENFPLLIYPRPGTVGMLPKIDLSKANIQHFENLPLIEISSTLIRERVKKGKSIQYMVPETVKNQIVMRGLYL